MAFAFLSILSAAIALKAPSDALQTNGLPPELIIDQARVAYESRAFPLFKLDPDREDAMLAKQMAVAKLIRVHRVRGHLIADLDPLRWKEPLTPRELDPATYGLTIWDLDREFLTDGVGGTTKLPLGDLLGLLRDCDTARFSPGRAGRSRFSRWGKRSRCAAVPQLLKQSVTRDMVPYFPI